MAYICCYKIVKIMERLNEYLRNLSIESLMNLSRSSEDLTFEENSIIRHLISEYEISSENVLEEAENLEKQLQEIEISYATEKQRVESIFTYLLLRFLLIYITFALEKHNSALLGL